MEKKVYNQPQMMVTEYIPVVTLCTSTQFGGSSSEIPGEIITPP